ncbi:MULTISPECIES: RNA repair transcriptional activator RtcR [unclassified Variovorax]|uniref:RNA repair transcriptional activator RtcR n=1 Tax=unclassified Variovorax TaxID=663243 RepID=UPI0013172E01|nr:MULTISPECIES: RNA repair transcriptional activator RtcR [unclassified Variovorax]VTU43067.1 Nif-specific regulatory protein [Variovorax sp. SRS16]VTU43096.1 Nif-specific regulatory protein [Variovorax sp. PBL-E5]VTU43477.1 Nif-specific regulatory protein [Variovorax sp. PBL-H6]
MSRTVVLGFLGSQLDSGLTAKRWERWRPTVSLAAQGEIPVDRIELFTFKAAESALAEVVKSDMETLSPDLQVTVHDLAINDPWNFPSVYAALHEFARGYEFQEDTNYYVHLSTGTHVAQICLFLLTEARYFPGKLLGTRKGTSDGKPWEGRAEVIDLDLSTYDQLSSRFRREQDDDLSLLKGGIVTRNAAFNQLIARIEKVSLRSTAPILLTGPTGAGKSQLAARIHALRARKRMAQGAFVEVNCATLRGENAMSTLFGHKKGAYTGATSDRAGLLRSADGGILFLDEIGELALDEQAMLLRALEHKRFMPLGADTEVESRFQLLAGTNKDLAVEVSKGTFRADLLARINMWTFELPGLAARPEDIEPNLDFELECATEELGTKVSMNSEAREAYLDFAGKAPWPGNFRDFKASIARMATLCTGGRIRLSDVTDECAVLARQNRFSEPARTRPHPAGDLGDSLTGAVDRVLGSRASQYDPFDLAQLETVLRAVATARSLAEAGRHLFSVSRQGKAKSNDSDRLKKYLARFALEFLEIKQQLGGSPGALTA